MLICYVQPEFFFEYILFIDSNTPDCYHLHDLTF